MLETPMLKMVKIREKCMNMETSSNFIQDFYDEFMKKTLTAFVDAEEEIIREFAEKEDLSLKCAKYFINKNFNFKPEVVYPDGPMSTPSFALTLVPKSVEEILDDIDTLPETNVLNECEREFLEKHSNDKWKWIK